VSALAQKIHSLVAGYSRSSWETRLMVMLNGFIDDSGNGDPTVFVLAGYVSTPAKWMAFQDEWADALRLSPSIEYFKAKEAAPCYGQFERWKYEDRNERLDLLCSIIRNHTISAIACVVPMADYNRIFKSKISRTVDTPYFLAFYGVMTLFFRLQFNSGDDRPTDFVFDEQGKQIGNALSAWKYFIEGMSPEAMKYIGNPPISRDDKEVLPLQAADLLAWTVRRKFVDAKTGKNHEMIDLCGLQYVDDVWDRARLQSMYDKVQAMKSAMKQTFPYDLAPPKERK
jgi:hypothetical protein